MQKVYGYSSHFVEPNTILQFLLLFVNKNPNNNCGYLWQLLKSEIIRCNLRLFICNILQNNDIICLSDSNIQEYGAAYENFEPYRRIEKTNRPHS